MQEAVPHDIVVQVLGGSPLEARVDHPLESRVEGIDALDVVGGARLLAPVSRTN